ncbi:hypothetical protein L6452_43357 [Arctium lappa]|uniref:Uncharacterized protein n=1 Tax=Arctium lappa TaxID=4217 RepID=A0ACB8XMK1_ARCLA|nr:hypothetical protein L6452_43357 [Arctium lappa]
MSETETGIHGEVAISAQPSWGHPYGILFHVWIVDILTDAIYAFHKMEALLDPSIVEDQNRLVKSLFSLKLKVAAIQFKQKVYVRKTEMERSKLGQGDDTHEEAERSKLGHSDDIVEGKCLSFELALNF